MSFNCFSVWTRVPARSAVELSARIALTKGFRGFVIESLDRLDFVLISSEGQIWCRSHARCAHMKLESRVWNLRNYWKIVAAGSARSRRCSTLKCLKVFRKECMQEFLKDLKSWKASEGFEPTKLSKGRDGQSTFFIENLQNPASRLIWQKSEVTIAFKVQS